MKTIKRDFNRLGRNSSFQPHNQQQTMPAPSNGALSDEHTPLIGRTQNHEGESRFSTIPKHVIHLTYATLASNYVNVLLVFVPIGIVAGIMGWNPTAVFVLNFIAIIPLAALLSFATEELSAKLGQTLGGLMNATFGNAVELIVSIVALKQGEIRIVQSPCWAPFSPTSCLSSAAASWPVAFATTRAASTRRSHPPCRR